MVERVARTFYERTHGAFIPDCAAPNDPPMFVPASWDSADVRDRDHHMANARAVLDAMREPTDAMLDAGKCTHEHWQRMIDAALSERREKGNG
jgi:hypothetical protein